MNDGNQYGNLSITREKKKIMIIIVIIRKLRNKNYKKK